MPARSRAPRESDKFKPQAQAQIDAAVAEVAKEKLPGWSLHGPRPNARIKATPETIRAVLAGIESGLTADKAIMLAGISEPALERWKKTNATLSQLFKQAELKIEQELIGFVRAASRKDWKAGAWLLERRFQWEQRTKTELTGKGGAALTVSQQLFASVAGGGDRLARARKELNVTPRPSNAKLGGQRTNDPLTLVEAKVVV